MNASATNTVGLVTSKLYHYDSPSPFLLLSGKSLSKFQLAYETYGELNADKSNAVLICHALSGDAHVAGYHSEEDKKPGWWENTIGPGKAIDTNKYFVICSNVLGGCSGSTGPASICPETNEPYGINFPFITVIDMVHAQKKLVEHLGIVKLLSVVGGSMGGMQTLAWATEYPESVFGAVVIASTSSHSAQCIAFNEVGRQAIIGDKHFNDGHYYSTDETPQEGLAVARMIGHITYLSDESMDEKFGRRFQDLENKDQKSEMGYKHNLGIDHVFQIESYLRHQGATFNQRFDANSYLVITKAIDHFDLGDQYEGLDKACERIKSHCLVISYTSDWLYPTHHSKKIVKAMMKAGVNVSFSEIATRKGHDAFLLEDEYLSGYLKAFLSSLS